jgi:hypothetical protein
MVAVAGCCSTSPIHAQAPAQVLQRIVTPPPAARALRGGANSRLLSAQSLGSLLSAPLGSIGEADFDLNVEYTESKIYNPRDRAL